MLEINEISPEQNSLADIAKFLQQERDRLGMVRFPNGFCANNSTVAEKFGGQFWWSKSAPGEDKTQAHSGHHLAIIPSELKGKGIVVDISSTKGVLGTIDTSNNETVGEQLNNLTDNDSTDWNLIRDYAIPDPEEEKINQLISKFSR